jgi:hypothetical protein
MDTVRKDLKEKIQKMEKTEKEKRKNENILIIIAEKDFFRQEAIRLNQLCKELSLKLEEMNKDNKIKTEEIINSRIRWKESQGVNKQLVVELEKSLKNNKVLSENLITFNKKNSKNSQIKQNTQKSNNFNSIDNNFFKSNENKYLNQEENNFQNFNKMMHDNQIYDEFEMKGIQFVNAKDNEKIMRIIDKLKSELKKEKTRNNKIVGEFNKILLDKNKLEKIFVDCVEETRKEIMQRKIKDALNNKNSNFYNQVNSKKKESFPILNDIKYENYLSTDKKKLLEMFLSKEEVFNFLKENMFKFNNEDSSISQTEKKFFGHNTLSNFNFHGKNKKAININTIYSEMKRSKTPNII